MENRFNLMKNIILDQKVKDQLAQYYRERENIPITTHLLLEIWCIWILSTAQICIHLTSN